jgi:ubiquinone/menaquinone biosynthesis C-methylase UbiE
MYRFELPVDAGATTASTPEAWAKAFAASTKSNARKRLRLRLSPEARLIRRYVGQGAKILDAGCGFGDWVAYLRSAGYDAGGCDYSPELIRRLREAYPGIEWTQSDIRSLPQRSGSIDAIVSWGVIEHDEAGPGAALQEFRRVLRAGGVAIVTVPVDTPKARQAGAVFHRDDGRKRAFFQYLMSEGGLRREAEAAGFEIVESGTLPQAHINHLAPRLARRLPRLLHGAANLAVQICLSWSERYRVMLFAVLRKPS